MTLVYLDSSLPRLLSGEIRVREVEKLVEQAALHQEELREDWRLARQQAPLRAIAPLE